MCSATRECRQSELITTNANKVTVSDASPDSRPFTSVWKIRASFQTRSMTIVLFEFLLFLALPSIYGFLDKCTRLSRVVPGHRHHMFLGSLRPRDEYHPNATPNQRSSGGCYYGEASNIVDKIYPPDRLEERNAASRSDGYWPYIQVGQTPPSELVYGEFDFYFFAKLMDQAALHGTGNWDNKVFLDMGSGTGRLVMAMALLHPNLKQSRGIELLASLDAQAREKQTGLLPHHASQMAQMQFICGSFDDPKTFIGDADCIFVFSTAMPEHVRANLANAVGRQCRPGTIVISTDYMLPLTGNCKPLYVGDSQSGSFEMVLVDKIDGYDWTTGGTSTGFVHKVVQANGRH